MKKKKNLAIETIGWYGTGAILLAYALVSFGIITADGVAFQLLNLTGAIGIIIISLQDKVEQTVILNLFWASIAAIALLRLLFL